MAPLTPPLEVFTYTTPPPHPTTPSPTTRIHLSPIDRAIITRLSTALADTRPSPTSPPPCHETAGVNKPYRVLRTNATYLRSLVQDPQEARRRVLEKMGIEVLPALVPGAELEEVVDGGGAEARSTKTGSCGHDDEH